MKYLEVFLLGMTQYRWSLTPHFPAPLDEAYERGRELAHLLTFRRYDS